MRGPIPADRLGMATMRSRQSNQFEPQFISQNPHMMQSSRSRMTLPDNRILALPSSQQIYSDSLEKWLSKPTQQGFLYFHLKGTKTYQWNFPRFYDPEIKKTRPYFVDTWIKKYDNRGKKYWQNMNSKHIQHVKPDSETYLIQAAIAGNLAFIEIYIKSKGSLIITDQQKRTALHHAVSNGHREITAMLCEFCYALVESQDINGCTPVFMATRYNETQCLKLLISYDCNIYQKMRNGDTCLHVAGAYNSLESMILLTNFGGMELFLQRNRYGLRAIEIAQKMRNYECYEILQNLERNVQYSNALLEREIQSLDTRGARGARSSRLDHLGNGANYPQLVQSRQQPITQQSHRSRGEYIEQTPYQNVDDSSIFEPSVLDLPFEDDDNAATDAFQSLGGRNGYQQRMNDFEGRAKQTKHERRYTDKAKKEQLSERTDQDKRIKNRHDVDFDDYRKVRDQKKTNLTNIKEEEYYQDDRQTRLRNQETKDPRQSTRKSHIEQEQLSSRNHPQQQVSSRDGTNKQHSTRQTSQRQLTSSRSNEGSQNRYLQRHLSGRFTNNNNENNEDYFEGDHFQDADNGRNTDEERDGSTRRSQRALSSRSMGDPYKVSRSRRRREEDEQKSFAEIAYVKTSAIVSTVKDYLVSGLSKIKTFVMKPTTRTSRHRRRDNISDSSDESSLDRYKTPMGRRSKSRAQSRAFSKIVPIDAPGLEEIMTSELEERKRHVNFNVNRVISVQPQIVTDETESDRERRNRQPPQNKNKTIKIQVEQQKPQQKSAFKSQLGPQETTQFSPKSVGVGSYNVHEESVQQQKVDVSRPQNYQSVEQQSNSNNNTGEDQHQSTQNKSNGDKKKRVGVKNMQLHLKKNYQSSEERVGDNQVQDRRTTILRQIQSNQDQQLSPSSKESSLQRQEEFAPLIQEQKHMELARQLSALSPMKQQAKIPDPKGSRGPSFAAMTTAAGSLHKKSLSVMGSIGSQQKRAPLSQEQFDMIMLNSEQDDGKRNSHPSKTVKPLSESIKAPVEVKDDIQQFYEDLIQNASLSMQVKANTKQQAVEQTSVDESNISNLYNKIMSDQPFESKRPKAIETPKKRQSPQTDDQKKEELKKADPEISFLTDFNPPTQRLGRTVSIRIDASFQTGISDLRHALEEEEAFEQVSNCSFLTENSQNPRQINLEILQSNILDKGQFLASQNSMQSIRCNNSHLPGRNAISSNNRPIALQMLTNQNNSMHFNTGLINSFTCQQSYQSDNEEHKGIGLISGGSMMRQISETPTKKAQIPMSNIASLNIGKVLPTVSLQTFQVSQSHNPNSSGPEGAGWLGVGSALSDHTSSSAGVVMMSQTSNMTKKFSQQDSEAAVSHNTKPIESHKKMIDLFKEDPSPSPPKAMQRFVLPDDTQTDLESGGFKQKKSEEEIEPIKLIEDEINTFQGLSSRSEHRIHQDEATNNQQVTEFDSTLNEPKSMMKKQIMKKLIEIMDDDDQELGDDMTINYSASKQFIEKNLNQEAVLRIDEQPFSSNGNSNQLQIQPANKSTAKRNTRYGDAENSVINFDLTSSKIVEDDESMRLTAREEQQSIQPEVNPIQRKSLKLQIQEQIQSVVISESLQLPTVNNQPRKTLLSEMEAVVLPLVILKSAFKGEKDEVTLNQLEAEAEVEESFNSYRKNFDRQYNKAKPQDNKQKEQQPSLNGSSQDSIMHELDSISRIYNGLEIVNEEATQSLSMIKVNNLDDQLEDIKQQPIKENLSPDQRRQVLGLQQISRGSSPVVLGVSGRKDNNLPPLIRVNSEDEGGDSRSRIHDIFYPKDTVRPGTPTRYEGAVTQEIPGYLQWAREDKQNRSTATPLANYNTSSDEEGRIRPKKMINRLLNQYKNQQLHSSVMGGLPLYQQKNTQLQPLTQKKDKDVSFKATNVSTTTDAGEKIKETMKKLMSNKLLNK